MAENTQAVRLNITLPSEAADALKDLASSEGKSRSQVLAEMVLERKRAHRKQEFLAELDRYYSDPECREFEEQTAEEWMAADAPLPDDEEWPDAPR